MQSKYVVERMGIQETDVVHVHPKVCHMPKQEVAVVASEQQGARVSYMALP